MEAIDRRRFTDRRRSSRWYLYDDRAFWKGVLDVDTRVALLAPSLAVRSGKDEPYGLAHYSVSSDRTRSKSQSKA